MCQSLYITPGLVHGLTPPAIQQVLMRLIDDWLLITADRSKATRFYDIVSNGKLSRVAHLQVSLYHLPSGHPEYGCFISKDKSLLNFDHPELVTIVDPRSKGTVV